MKLIKLCLSLTIMAVMALPAMSLAEESTASITWNAWGRGIFVPVASNDDGDTVPRDVASWGGLSRIGFTIKGESERAGFWVDMNADGGSLGMQDQQKIWVKPLSNLTVEIGPTIFYDTLRGNAMFGSWNWWRFDNMLGEDNIFLRGVAGGGDAHWLYYGAGSGGRYSRVYETEPDAGAIIHWDKNGFHAFASLNVVEGTRGEVFIDDDTIPEHDINEKYTSEIMFKRGQYGLGYEIPDFGLVRAQVFGKAYVEDAGTYAVDKLDTYYVFNAALKIDKLVENLYLDMGVFLSSEDDAENHRAAIYANYKMGSVTPHFLLSAEFDQEKYNNEDDTEMGLKVGLGADVDLGNDLTLNLDLRYHNETAAQYEDGQTAFLVGIQRGFSNGLIGIALETTTKYWNGGGLDKEEDDDLAWAIPIKLEYWF